MRGSPAARWRMIFKYILPLVLLVVRLEHMSPSTHELLSTSTSIIVRVFSLPHHQLYPSHDRGQSCRRRERHGLVHALAARRRGLGRGGAGGRVVSPTLGNGRRARGRDTVVEFAGCVACGPNQHLREWVHGLTRLRGFVQLVGCKIGGWTSSVSSTRRASS